MLKWTLASMYLFEWWLSPDICLRVALMDHICCCSVTQSYQNLCNPMDCGTLGFPVLHHLPELAQTHVYCQWCHPTISSSAIPFSSCFNLSQHQGLFHRVSSLHQVAKVLEFQLQISSSSEYSGLIFFGWTGWISLQSQGLSRVFSNTTVRKNQFFSAQPSLLSNSHILLEKP